MPSDTAACEWCGRAIAQNTEGRWYAVKGEERGYDPLTCEASDDGRHEPDHPEVTPVATAAIDVIVDVVGPQAAEQVLVALEAAHYEVRYVGPGDESP